MLAPQPITHPPHAVADPILIGSLVAYWFGYLEGFIAFMATLVALIYYSMLIWKMWHEEKPDIHTVTVQTVDSPSKVPVDAAH